MDDGKDPSWVQGSLGRLQEVRVPHKFTLGLVADAIVRRGVRVTAGWGGGSHTIRVSGVCC